MYRNKYRNKSRKSFLFGENGWVVTWNSAPHIQQMQLNKSDTAFKAWVLNGNTLLFKILSLFTLFTKCKRIIASVFFLLLEPWQRTLLCLLHLNLMQRVNLKKEFSTLFTWQIVNLMLCDGLKVSYLNGVLRTVLGVCICWRWGVTPLKSLSCSGVLRPPFRGVSMLVRAIRFWASWKYRHTHRWHKLIYR